MSKTQAPPNSRKAFSQDNQIAGFASSAPVLERVLGCAALEIVVRAEWGAKHSANYRRSIREALAHQFASRDLMNLNVLPELPDLSISISHCALGGGFALCKKDAFVEGIGFDLEEPERIRSEVIKRVCQEEELSSLISVIPALEYIWAAKEAAFKSLQRVNQPATLSCIEILDHNPGKSLVPLGGPSPSHESSTSDLQVLHSLWRYTAFTRVPQQKEGKMQNSRASAPVTKCQISGQGVVFKQSGLICGIFVHTK